MFEKEMNEIDKWKEIRKVLYRNREPKVEMIAMTTPLNNFDKLVSSETLPGFTARQSHESKGEMNDDIELNKKLISWGHHTPLEALQFVFHVNGISKSLSGQWTRHRLGIGWTFRSTRYVKADKNGFVYPALEYINDEEKVKKIYKEYENLHIYMMDKYKELEKLDVKNQELRRMMPVGFETSTYCYINSRALRHFLELRLSIHAEWEIRRLAYLMYNSVIIKTPSIFEDIGGKFNDK